MNTIIIISIHSKIAEYMNKSIKQATKWTSPWRSRHTERWVTQRPKGGGKERIKKACSNSTRSFFLSTFSKTHHI